MTHSERPTRGLSHSEELLRHEAPISKAQKRDLINKVQGKSGKETEKLLSNTFPEVM